MNEHDVIIFGAGPAGLSAAIRLHALGHRVAVVAAPSIRTQRQLETVPRLEVITQAFPGLELNPPTLVDATCDGVSWWTGEENVTREVSVIDRGSASEPGLDALLLDHARRVGIVIHAVERGTARVSFDESWHVTAPLLALRSRFLIDASGRHSSLHRRSSLTAWRQVAITGVLRLKPGAPALWTESLPDGWMWAIRDHAARWLVSLFVDPSSLLTGRERLWLRSLIESRLVKEFVSSLSTTLDVREVTPAAADRVFTLGLLHLGDAALARCPLASQGLSSAISDGQSAAIAVHSLLRSSASESVVSEFLETKHRQNCLLHRKFIATSYASTPHTTEYWQQRGNQTLANLPVPAKVPDLDQPISIASDWQFRPHPILVGESIRVADCLCSKDEALRFLSGYSVVDLLEPRFTGAKFTARLLLHKWSTYFSISKQSALCMFVWLRQRGVIVPA